MFNGFPRPKKDVKSIPVKAYIPPTDWINIDDCANGNINLLVADTSMATYAFICTTDSSQYHIDWGDGTSGDFNSGDTAQHTYTVGAGQVCSRGYTTFKIVISPVSGNLTSFRVTPHSLATQVQQHDILACVCGATILTTLTQAFFKATTTAVQCRVLESFKTINKLLVCTDTSYMFSSCCSLQSVDVSGMTAVTNASCMFQNCHSLKSVDVSGMTAVTTASNMFNSCYSLKNVDVSGMTAVTIVTLMFRYCYSLQSVDVSGMNLLIDASNMFSGCYSLKSVDVSGMTAVTNASNMFGYCYSLKSVDVSGMTAVTNTSYMFSSCYSLQSVDVSGMTAVTNASYMFQSCYSLSLLMATNFAQEVISVNCLTMFTNCEQLTDINMPNAKVTALTAKGASDKLNKLETLTFHAESTFSGSSPQLDIQYNTLTAEQLNTIFTSLPTVTDKTVNITGCTGAETCTRSIATNKGWTVTG